MAKNTWLKLWRSTAKNPLIKNAKASQLFLWMLLEAAWTKKRERGVDLQPGELLTSMPKIQFELTMTNKQARAAVELLEGLKIVAHERAPGGRGSGRGSETIFRFVNWSKHQSREEEGRESGHQEGESQGVEGAREEEFSHTGKEDLSPKNLRTKKDKKEPSADAVAGKAFTDYFYEKHLRAHQQKPSPPVWTFKSASKLVASLGRNEVQRRCDNFFADPYLKAHPLEVFLRSPDTWIEKRVKLNTDSRVDTQVQRDRKQTAL